MKGVNFKEGDKVLLLSNPEPENHLLEGLVGNIHSVVRATDIGAVISTRFSNIVSEIEVPASYLLKEEALKEYKEFMESDSIDCKINLCKAGSLVFLSLSLGMVAPLVWAKSFMPWFTCNPEGAIVIKAISSLGLALALVFMLTYLMLVKHKDNKWNVDLYIYDKYSDIIDKALSKI